MNRIAFAAVIAAALLQQVQLSAWASDSGEPPIAAGAGIPVLQLRESGHSAFFSRDGAVFVPERGPACSFALRNVESGGRRTAIESGKTDPVFNRSEIVDYDRGGLIERYIGKEKGIEQQFILSHPISHGRDLAITTAIDCGASRFSSDVRGWVWTDDKGSVRLGHVYVTDAAGKVLKAAMAVSQNQQVISIRGAELAQAAYPVVIDPEVWIDDFRISTNGPDGNPDFDAGSPDVACGHGSAGCLVVWVADNDNDNEREVWGRLVYSQSNMPRAPFKISDAGPDGDWFYGPVSAAVAYNMRTDEFLVVWNGIDDAIGDDRYEVFGQRIRAADGAEVGPNDFRISDMGGNEPGFDARWGVDVAYNGTDNRYLVVWAGEDNVAPLVEGELEIFGQLLSGNDASEIGTNDFRISDMGVDGELVDGAYYPAVAYGSVYNQFLVVWQGSDIPNHENEIYGQFLDGSSGAEVGTNDMRISDMGREGDASLNAYEPDVTYNYVHQVFLVAWSGNDDSVGIDPAKSEIFGQLLSAGEMRETGFNDFRISTMGPNDSAAFNAFEPAVTFDPGNGEFFAVWRGDQPRDSADDEFEIYGQALNGMDAMSARGTSNIRLSNMGLAFDPAYGARLPAAAYNFAGGSVLVSWEGSDSRDGRCAGENEIFGQLYYLRQADRSISGSAFVNPLAAGSDLVYRFDIANTGPDAIFSLVFDFSIPDGRGLRISETIAQYWSCSTSAISVRCENRNVGVQTAPSVFVHVSTPEAMDGTFDARAVLHAAPWDPDSGNNIAAVNTVVGRDADHDLLPDISDPDDDGDGLLDADETRIGTLPLTADTDRDGVSDGQEVEHGTDPRDRGSLQPVLAPYFCAEWNGFLEMWNVAEFINTSGSELQLATIMSGAEGTALAAEELRLPAAVQRDLLVHDMRGWRRDGYGSFCTLQLSGSAGDLDGRMVYYKPARDYSSTGKFDFVFAMPFQNGIKGMQAVQFNTFQPSLDPADAANLVVNWIEIINMDAAPQTGVVMYYDSTGRLLTQTEVSLSPGARGDYPAHQFGPNVVGLALFYPDNSDAAFLMRNVRYYYDNSGGRNTFTAAYQLEGIVGTFARLVVPVDTRSGTAVLELSNTGPLAQDISVEIRDAAGVVRHRAAYLAGGHGTQHVIVDPLLPNSLGTAEIRALGISGITAVAMQYKRTRRGGIDYIYGTYAKEAVGGVLRSSYNTYLGQSCRLLLSNVTAAPSEPRVSMSRLDGTTVLAPSAIRVPAGGVVEYDACAHEATEAYGTVTVEPAARGSIAANLIRIGRDDHYRLPIPVR